jgi:hypothetical protein
MHGSVESPEDIIFTKQDYIRYADRFAALSGIVQTMLLTRHMLFVGFSLDDDNFQRIFDTVRRAHATQMDTSSSLLEPPNNKILEDSPKASKGKKHSEKNNVHERSYLQNTALLLEHSIWKVSFK